MNHIKFHPIHYTALLTVIILIGSLFLAYTQNNVWVFISACLILPHLVTVGRFESSQEEEQLESEYADEPRAGFAAKID
jgi:1,4-dihydroxy-2-naphthoate octaprenyltransferase